MRKSVKQNKETNGKKIIQLFWQRIAQVWHRIFQIDLHTCLYYTKVVKSLLFFLSCFSPSLSLSLSLFFFSFYLSLSLILLPSGSEDVGCDISFDYTFCVCVLCVSERASVFPPCCYTYRYLNFINKARLCNASETAFECMWPLLAILWLIILSSFPSSLPIWFDLKRSIFVFFLFFFSSRVCGIELYRFQIVIQEFYRILYT